MPNLNEMECLQLAVTFKDHRAQLPHLSPPWTGTSFTQNHGMVSAEKDLIKTTKSVVKQWDRLPKEEVVTPNLSVFKGHLGSALNNLL